MKVIKELKVKGSDLFVQIMENDEIKLRDNFTGVEIDIMMDDLPRVIEALKKASECKI